MAAIAWLTGG
ncbi:hypothetical protein VCHC47A1_1551, partial [Vibrio cholerae HC-47A1]